MNIMEESKNMKNILTLPDGILIFTGFFETDCPLPRHSRQTFELWTRPVPKQMKQGPAIVLLPETHQP